MKERPILFSAPMVRAILDGRKTVTRRPVKGCVGVVDCVPCSRIVRARLGNVDESTPIRCPFGATGDRLWVRETWRVTSSGRNYQSQTTTVYVEHRERSLAKPRSGGAQNQSAFMCSDNESDALLLGAYGGGKAGAWRPSIHMPRWASRLTLEVVSIGVVKLSEIDDAEAKREGFATATEATEAIRALYPEAKWFWRIEFRRIDR